MDLCLGNDSQATAGRDVKAAKKDIKANNPNILKFKNGPKKFKKRRNDFKKGRGLIYLGRIPHGFYEDQMTAYFNQFGKVISAVVPRSEKSGRSKGYGYVEFEDEEVAKIAAEAMNNYLMYNKIIKCRYITPEERRKSGLLRAKTIHTCPGVLNRIKNENEKRESLSKLNFSAYQKKTEKKIAEFKKFFQERGIDFNFKVDINNSKDISNDSEKDEIKGSTNADEEMEQEIEDQFGVLEIDASDGEIHFKIPPQVKKVIKKSSNSVISPKDNSKMRKKLRTKRPKKSSLKESEQIVKPNSKPPKRATKNLEKKLEVKLETLKRVLKKEKSRPLKKRNDTLLKQKKSGIKVIARTLKKEGNNMQQK